MRKFIVYGIWFMVYTAVMLSLPLTINYKPLTTYATNPEEEAIYKACGGTIPSEFCTDKPAEDKNIIQQFLSSITSTLGNLIGLINPSIANPPKYYSQSEINNQANIPNLEDNNNSNQVLGVKEDVIGGLKGFLGGNTGFFGASSPDFVDTNEVKDSECLNQKSYYPEGVHPITGKAC